MLVVCVLGGGCDIVWRLDDLRSDASTVHDGVRPADALCGGFGPRDMVIVSMGNNDPTLSADGLELFFVRGSPGVYELWHDTRQNTTELFTGGTPVVELNSTSEDSDPALTEDGGFIMFKSDRSGTPRAYQAGRLASGDIFTTPVLVPGLEAVPVFGLDLSPDGLTIYYDSGGQLVTGTRAGRSAPLINLNVITPDRVQFPSVSADGLELFYSGAGGLMHRTRTDTASKFDPATDTVVDDGGGDGDITPDNKHLVFTGGSVTYRRDRCL
jgi:hypothetical protein